MKELKLGQVVYSKAGRDSGRFMIVVDIDNIKKGYVSVADGDVHRIDKPKKKNLKHLAKTNSVISNIKEKLVKKETVLDASLRDALKAASPHSFINPEI